METNKITFGSVENSIRIIDAPCSNSCSIAYINDNASLSTCIDSTSIFASDNNKNSEKKCVKKSKNEECRVPNISRVIFNDPATIVYWEDKTKTVVKCNEADEFDEEKGLAMAIAEKYFGGYMPLKRMVKKYRKVEE